MKKVLVILDGYLAKPLLKKIVDLNNNLNSYDITYTDDNILIENLPSNFTLYKFDPTSLSKLNFVLKNALYQDCLILQTTKDETINVVENIRAGFKELFITIYDNWDLEFNDQNIQYYRGHNVISSGLAEQLPNIPVFAQNIGLRQGEIMEIKIPFGSTYAYRYIGSIIQKEWKISALYRNQQLTDVKPSFVLKPNDIIIVIGRPEVLIQVYNAISKTSTQFPMPFGKNIYLYIDLLVQSEDEVLEAVHSTKIMQQRLNNTLLIVKITRPTNVKILNKIKDSLVDVKDVNIIVDYFNLGIHNIIKQDKIKYDIGMIILSQSFFKYKESMKNIIKQKLPILKLGKEKISALKNSLVLLNDEVLYEQISPILFDISSQLKIKPKILDIDPIGDQNRENILAHLNNLAKIFTQNISVVKEQTNPIKRLNKENNILQILPLIEEMFEKRSFKFLTTNSDLLSFDMNKTNQLLIPVVESNNE